MPDHAANARLLLTESPDNYVSARTRLVKQARAEGDRASANFYQSLKRPNLSLWAVLAVGDDANAVNDIVTATAELAEIQSGGAGSGALTAATKNRRKALEALVDRAVKALARSVGGAEARRAEIRDIVDLLSRHPAVAGAWIDGTLRDLPDDAFGFAAFTGSIDSATTVKGAEVAIPRTRRAAKASKPGNDDTAPPRSADVAAERAARVERAQRARQARQDVAAADRQLATAERRVAAAQTAVREAEEALRLAEEERVAAQQRRDEATAQLEANRPG